MQVTLMMLCFATLDCHNHFTTSTRRVHISSSLVNLLRIFHSDLRKQATDMGRHNREMYEPVVVLTSDRSPHDHPEE